MALPADGVPVFSGWLHVVAVTITGGPFFPRLAASLHQLLGRHYIQTQTPISRFIPLSAASISGELQDDSAGGRGGCRIHHHRIPSVPRSKILQAIYVGSECLIPKVDLGDCRSSGIAKNRLCFSPQPLALTGRQVWKPRIYKRTFGAKRFVTSWIIGAGAERQSRTLALHSTMVQGRDRKPVSGSFNNRRCIPPLICGSWLL